MQTEPEQPLGGVQGSPVEESPKKKSVVGKFKDKARKLKTKIKKPKSPGSAENNGSSSSSGEEEESGSDQYQQIGDQPGEGRDVKSPSGLKGDSLYEAGPETRVREGIAPPTEGVEEKLGNLQLGDAGKSPKPVDEGKNAEGKDLLATTQEPTPIDEDNTLQKHLAEGAAATAATGAAAAGVHSLSESDRGEGGEHVPAEKKGLLAQAHETVFGSGKKEDGEPFAAVESKVPTPTITERAIGLKDTVAAKLGYGGVNQGVTGETEKGDISVDQKPYTERAIDAATGAKNSVAEKIGYGGAASTTSPTSEGEQKTYVQKAQEAALGAKDAVAAKLGYTGEGENAPASPGERFHPGEEDVALSQLITDKMSTGATTVRETLLRPFGGKSGPPTPTTTPPPSSAQAVASDPAHAAVPGAEAAGGENPGIVGKVTGAVTSLLGTSGSGKKVDEPTSTATDGYPASEIPKVGQ